MKINFHRSKQAVLAASFIGLLAVGFNNCGQPGQIGMSITEASQSVFDICGKNNNSCDPYSYVVKKNSYVVKAVDKVDVLVVIDNSGSMAYEQMNMAQRFSGFINQLDAYGLDWNIGIITTDVSKDADLKDGRLVNFRDSINNPPIANKLWLSKSNTSLAEASSLFAATIQRQVSEGSGYEQGIKASYRLIERLNAGEYAGFIRADAAFSVIVVTDDDESPSDKAPGTTGYIAPELRNDPSEWYKIVKSVLGGLKNVSFNSIIVKPNDQACKANVNLMYDSSGNPIYEKDNNGNYKLDSSGNKIQSKNQNEDYGNKYAELTNMTGGVLGSVCEADYSQQLKVVGNKVIDQIKEINLECVPVDANNDGQPDLTVMHEESSGWVPFSSSGYNLTANRFTFNDYAAAGGWEFKYTCKK